MNLCVYILCLDREGKKKRKQKNKKGSFAKRGINKREKIDLFIVECTLVAVH